MPLGQAEYDEAYYAANGQGGDRPALRYYARLVSRYLEPTRVLDVGCGTGHLLARLSRSRPADGFEISAYSAEVARSTSPGSQVFVSASSLPAATYDAITAVHVFEHIPDEALVQLLQELRRASTPSARILMVVPDPAGRAAALHGEKWNGWTDPTHVNLKSHDEWRAFLELNGLTVRDEGSDGLWNFPYSALPVPLDAVRHGLPMAVQYLSGRMILKPGVGESSFFILGWAEPAAR
ncbi:class I SAM-dependent methyltransferase [Oerskovia sp. NPDC060287]|uniref:class I SAM-dependent methyltransferase n=1 Tax=Oerskovia sp. NPDC060287 TaxID=3347095 RepID=UPI003667D916